MTRKFIRVVCSTCQTLAPAELIKGKAILIRHHAAGVNGFNCLPASECNHTICEGVGMQGEA